MSQSPRIILVCLLAVGPALVAPRAGAQETAAHTAASVPAPAAEIRYANKWRLQVSEGANNDGVMLFRLTPKGGTPIEIRVPLEDGRGEDGCARDIRDAFKQVLDKKLYKVEVDDGEDVLVKKRSGPDFAIELVESTVQGTRINFDRE